MDIALLVQADRYFKGQCTAGEAKLVLDWLETEAGQRYLALSLEEDEHLLDDSNIFMPQAEVPSAKMFEAILTKINAGETALDADPAGQPAAGAEEAAAAGNSQPTSFYRSWQAVAATFAGLLLLGAMLYQFLVAGRPVVHATGYGEIARIVLPDSSTVSLNSNSSIEYDGEWDQQQARQVKLKGEAYFSVVHKQNNQKFLVTTPDEVQVEVLGTEFNVSSRQRRTQVVLASGKVRLQVADGQSGIAPVVMQPGEAVEIPAAQDRLHRRRVDPAVFSSWKNDKLLFDNTSVREIFERIQDTYGYQIQVADTSLLGQRITGSVPNKDIDMVLEGLGFLLDARVSRSANQIKITTK
jgi:transmembrane sensor